MLSRRLYVLLFSMTRDWSEIIVRFVRVSVWASGQMENRYFEGVLELLKYIFIKFLRDVYRSYPSKIGWFIRAIIYLM